jgi:hypothetical protein
MKNTPTCVSCTVSALELVGLLWWNTGDRINFEKKFENVDRTLLRETGSFPRANAVRERLRGEDGVLAAVQPSPSTSV